MKFRMMIKDSLKNLWSKADLCYTVCRMAIIQLTRGFSTVVDDQDFENLRQFRWCAMGPVNGGYYAIRRSGGKIVSLARFLTGAMKGQVVDHINGDSLDNRRENLRLIRQGDNIRNAKLSKRNTSGLTGVSWDKRRKRFIARAYFKGKGHHIGSAKTLEQAAAMHKEFMEREFKKNYYTEIYPKRYGVTYG